MDSINEPTTFVVGGSIYERSRVCNTFKRDMIIQNIIVSVAGTNCYLVKEKDSQAGFIVDPGGNPRGIIALADKMGLVPQGILLTHGHFDHMLAAPELKSYWDIPIYAGEKERQLLLEPHYSLALHVGENLSLRADKYIEEKDNLIIGNTKIRIIETPGHTPGGICYYIEEEKVIFVGDTLFYESVGRTDFPGGSMSTLQDSIRRKLFTLPDDVSVYSGHGSDTTIGHEKKYNPWIKFN